MRALPRDELGQARLKGRGEEPTAEEACKKTGCDTQALDAGRIITAEDGLITALTESMTLASVVGNHGRWGCREHFQRRT
jgi:hypothetical protein